MPDWLVYMYINIQLLMSNIMLKGGSNEMKWNENFYSA